MIFGVTGNNGSASRFRHFFGRSLLKGACLLGSVVVVVTASLLLASVAPRASAATGSAVLNSSESQNGGNVSRQPLTSAATPGYHEIAPAANVYLKHVDPHGATTFLTAASSGCAWHSFEVVDGSILEWLGADFCWNGYTAMAYNVQTTCNPLWGSFCQYNQYGIQQQYTSAVYVWAHFYNTYDFIGSGAEELRIQVDQYGNVSTNNWDF